MAQDVYQKLREQLDQYSIGFPATESGVEMEILKRLFTEAQADMFLDMTLFLETPSNIAARSGRDPEQTATLCEQMAQKGLIFRYRKQETVRYAAVPFVVGSYEFQLNNMDEALARLCDQYMTEALFHLDRMVRLPLRTIPVNKSVDATLTVASHDDARTILKSKKKIAITNCICRLQQHKTGNLCPKPLEVCFVFGSHADFYVENDMARFITQEEALAIQDKCEEYGLVNQPFNVINPGGMCNCCGDCCGVLRAIQRHPRPRDLVYANYRAVVDADNCTACGVCEERCQVQAIAYDDAGIAVINDDRCIGCGLCVTTCPAEAIRLEVVDEEHRLVPPATEKELFTEIAKIRGTNLVPLKMAGA